MADPARAFAGGGPPEAPRPKTRPLHRLSDESILWARILEVFMDFLKIAIGTTAALAAACAPALTMAAASTGIIAATGAASALSAAASAPTAELASTTAVKAGD